MRNSVLLWAALLSLLLGFSACAKDDDNGGGGGSSALRAIRVTRVGTIADGATDALGAVSTLSAAPQLTYTIHNDGTQDLTLSGGPGFVVASAITNLTGSAVTLGQPAAAVITAGGTQTFTVDYQVAAAGAFGFTLTFTSDADGGQTGATFEIVVSGTGDNSTRVLVVSRAGSITDSGTDGVGSIDATTAAPALTYTLTNNGTGVMSFTGSAPFVTVAASPAPVNITGTPAITQPGAGTIASGGGTQTFDVNYQVTGAGAFSFTVQFGTDASTGQTGPTFEFTISGTGTVPSRIVAVSRAFTSIADGGTLDLGNRAFGVAGFPVDFTIANTGTTNLTISGGPSFVTASSIVNITGGVTITQPASGTVVPSGNQAFSIAFTVTAQAAFSFQLSFASNATGGQTGGTFEINVIGQGDYSFSYQKRANAALTPQEPFVNASSAGFTELRLVTGGFSGSDTLQDAPTPSPNGAYILFSRQDPTNPNGARDLFVVASAGGTPVQINTNSTPGQQRYVVDFKWAPVTGANQYLLFRSDTDIATATAYELFTARITGTTPAVSNVNRIGGYGGSTATLKINFGFKWSSDASRIGFILNNTSTGNRQVWGCQFDTATHTPGTATRIDGAAAFTNAVYQTQEIEWGGNGTIAYLADDSVAGVNHLWASAISLGSGTLSATAAVLQTPNVTGSQFVSSNPGWGISPEGTRLAYIVSAAGIDHVYGVAINTSSSPTPVQLDNPATAQASSNCGRVKWSPTGNAVLMEADYLVASQFELFWQPLTTTSGAISLNGTSTNITQVPAGHSSSALFEFSPEGQRVLYRFADIGSGANKVGIATLSTTPTQINLTSSFANANPFINQLSWRPGDGMAVMFIGDGNTASITECWCVELRGAGGMTAGSPFTFSGTIASAAASAGNAKFIP